MKPDFETLTQELVLAARRGESAQASVLIPVFLGLLESEMPGMTLANRERVATVLPELLKAQTDGDWIRFADWMEEL
jgi:hypothetical protein